MNQFLNEKQKKQLLGAIVGVLGMLTIFLMMGIISSIKNFGYIGKGVYASNVITVNGTGEIMAVPDVASFSFSVVENSKLVADAQDKASKKMNSAIEVLKSLGIEEKDIKTTGYNSYPKYEWRNSICPTSVSAGAEVYCPSGKNVLIGYEVSQTITVKIRKTADAGAVLAKIGGLNVENISSLDFIVDDLDKVRSEARDKAIANAKEKAEKLSKSLGVKFVHIISFYEDGVAQNGYAGGYLMEAKSMASSMDVTPPQIPTGENKIVSNISITYEIK